MLPSPPELEKQTNVAIINWSLYNSEIDNGTFRYSSKSVIFGFLYKLLKYVPRVREDPAYIYIQKTLRIK